MALLDVFDTDAFSLHSLTIAIDKLPYTPGRVGRMNLFTNKPITTPVATIEERHGQLSILPTMERGSEQQTTGKRDRRKMRAFNVPHVPNWDAVKAEALEGKRSFGSEDQVEVFSQIVNDRLEAMKRDHAVTWEFHMLGALKGIVLDADLSEIVNWFTEFGIAQDTVDFSFADAGTYDDADPQHDMKKKAQEVIRLMQEALGGTAFSGVHAFCGNAFFDAFISHPTVRRAYERYQENAFARNLQSIEGGFEFAGITWENYRGSIGNVNFVESDEAHFFPLGTPDVFVEVPAPADFVETVNTRGQKLYAKQERMKWDKGVELHTQSNVLYMCTRPKALIKGVGTYLEGGPTTTAAPTTTV